MTSGIVLWAGKHLATDEEASLREIIDLYRRSGCAEDAEWFARFLPEHAASWSPDECEFGAHHGPWLDFTASVEESR